MSPKRLSVRKFRTSIIRPPEGTDWRGRMAEAEREMAQDFAEARAFSQWRQVRAARRLALILLWTVLCIPIQALAIWAMPVLGRRPAVRIARAYHQVLCRIAGIRVAVTGARAATDGRPVVFVANHTSWADILVLGATLEACFVSKAEVGTWPLIRTVARLGRTVFVSRRRTETGRERDELASRLAAGDSIILFPEGTTSDGGRVLPFRSALLGMVETGVAAQNPPLVQPVSLVFDRLDGLPVGRINRAHFAWFGDMAIAGHAWTMLSRRSSGATVLLHPPLDPAGFASRKALADAAFAAVDAGAAALRQGRRFPPGPMSPPLHGPGEAEDNRAA
ncbi:MAG: 1-acyl-sn-glycerol-3-phosphate acyltransferase [Acetobacteraceae bacterium]|jgi:1-acyl-sn-glycerol-3-phosphate acyltransferase|nr:1-acyl-sn-glycerol-3-phosphate acyltransferase [Acetobacteraceae bacterium]